MCGTDRPYHPEKIPDRGAKGMAAVGRFHLARPKAISLQPLREDERDLVAC